MPSIPTGTTQRTLRIRMPSSVQWKLSIYRCHVLPPLAFSGCSDCAFAGLWLCWRDCSCSDENVCILGGLAPDRCQSHERRCQPAALIALTAASFCAILVHGFNRRKLLRISKSVETMDAVVPPPTRISPLSSGSGYASGSRKRNALMTQTTEPKVNRIPGPLPGGWCPAQGG
jgi:hypothetical protein